MELNSRQREVLRLVCKGLRNAEIADLIGVKERTVKSYLAQLFIIFDVTNRTELVGIFADPELETTVGRRTSQSY
jgi:DNA-binding CsgD family transcriptional regulator